MPDIFESSKELVRLCHEAEDAFMDACSAARVLADACAECQQPLPSNLTHLIAEYRNAKQVWKQADRKRDEYERGNAGLAAGLDSDGGAGHAPKGANNIVPWPNRS